MPSSSAVLSDDFARCLVRVRIHAALGRAGAHVVVHRPRRACRRPRCRCARRRARLCGTSASAPATSRPTAGSATSPSGSRRSCTPAAATESTTRACRAPHGSLPAIFAALAALEEVVDADRAPAISWMTAPDRAHQVEDLPALAGVVRVDAARHAVQPGPVHRHERQVHADERAARTASCRASRSASGR